MSVLKAWQGDISTSLKAKEGWKYFGKFIVVIFTILGVITGIISYATSNYNRVVDQFQKNYEEFYRLISSDKSNERIMALLSVQYLMEREVADVSSGPQLFLSLFGLSHKEKILLPKIKNLFLDYIKRQKYKSANWTKEEKQQVFNILSTIQYEGWASGLFSKAKVDRAKSLNWLWRDNNLIGNNNELSSLLADLDLSELDLAKYNIEYCDFSRSFFSHSLFKGNTIFKGVFKNTIITNVTQEYNVFNSCVFEEAIIKNMDFYYCQVINSTYNKATLNNISMVFNNLARCRLENTRIDVLQINSSKLSDVIFRDAHISSLEINTCSIVNTNFHSAILDKAQIKADTLINVDFSSSSMVQACFDNSILNNVDFRGANLKGASFVNTKGIDSIHSWTGANIAYVKGLSYNQITKILKSGAVSIPENNKWREYKKRGRPLNWRII